MWSLLLKAFHEIRHGEAAPTKPFPNRIDPLSGLPEWASNLVERRLSELGAVFDDQQAWQAALAGGDPIIYQVAEVRVPEEYGHLLHGTTVIYPGRVGREYYATKGHYHTKRETGEIYLCQAGEGFLLMQNETGEESALPMTPGALNYIPPYWAHRSVNTGDKPLVFFAVWPADAGHDYGTIADRGFRIAVIEKDGRPTVIKR